MTDRYGCNQGSPRVPPFTLRFRSWKEIMSNVLIAEDDPHIQLLIRRQLEVAGYRVWATSDAAAALNHALEQPPDILVLDIMLPGKDRLEICRTINEHFGAKGPPVIIMSAPRHEMD